MRPSYHKTITKEFFTLFGLLATSITVVLAAIWLLVSPPLPEWPSRSTSIYQGSSYQSGASPYQNKQKRKSPKLRYRIQLPAPTLNYDGHQKPSFSSRSELTPKGINSNDGFKLNVSNITGPAFSVSAKGRYEGATTADLSESAPSAKPTSPTSTPQ